MFRSQAHGLTGIPAEKPSRTFSDPGRDPRRRLRFYSLTYSCKPLESLYYAFSNESNTNVTAFSRSLFLPLQWLLMFGPCSLIDLYTDGMFIEVAAHPAASLYGLTLKWRDFVDICCVLCPVSPHSGGIDTLRLLLTDYRRVPSLCCHSFPLGLTKLDALSRVRRVHRGIGGGGEPSKPNYSGVNERSPSQVSLQVRQSLILHALMHYKDICALLEQIACNVWDVPEAGDAGIIKLRGSGADSVAVKFI
ncbi:hypothetical protein MHYP_G00227820 [Metynnis hypsauchen]